jgi:uncharacterized protein YebE (UPF0316 family)
MEYWGTTMADIGAFITPDGITCVAVSLPIFFATVCEMSRGTLRVLFIDRGFRTPSAAFGLVEVLVWLMAISQIMRNLDNTLYYVANATGFSTGGVCGDVAGRERIHREGGHTHHCTGEWEGPSLEAE